MNVELKEKLKNRLSFIYDSETLADEIIEKLIAKQGDEVYSTNQGFVSEKDVMLITYGDSIINKGENTLKTLNDFLLKNIGDKISSVHILPMYPYTSDDGFSVVDYRKIETTLGDWAEIETLSQNYKLMFDAVINHASASCDWFKKFLECDDAYKNYFIVGDKNKDYSKVTRPRVHPLLTPFETKEGVKHVWTTFSEDQVDLNFKDIDLTVEILDLLVFYAKKGAKYIRLDAIGFMWKEDDTTCMHLDKTHELVKVMRDVLEYYAPGTILISETNVPHKDNIKYFGNGHDEAQMVYQFPLPPLTLFSFITENASKLTSWAKSLEPLTSDTTYFNFLASHDGIGVRPTEGILTEQERQILVDNTMKNGGRVSFKTNEDGSKSPYELNINYQDALSAITDNDEIRFKRFFAAQGILLSVVGVPGIYIHSLLGSRNDYYGVESSGINRRINREKLQLNELERELNGDTHRKNILEAMLKLIELRTSESAFSPFSTQNVLDLNEKVFAIERENKSTNEKIYAIINVSTQKIALNTTICGTDIISNVKYCNDFEIEPLQIMWIKE